MDLNEMLVFTRVVEAQSFVGAARALGMPKSTVSRKVSDLEERLGARLLQRTTRRLNLTEEGRAYFQHAVRVVAEAEEAELAVTRLQGTPRGLLRVTMPLNFDYFAPAVTSFLARYPEVELELVGTDRRVDLVQEGFDVAVRAGALADSTLVGFALGTLRSYAVASPQFLAKHGAPKTPEDLARFDCLVFGAGPDPSKWKLLRDDETRVVAVRGRLVVNDFEYLAQGASVGLGIAMLPVHRCAGDLRENRLRRVLPDWCSPVVPLHVVYPTTRHLSPKIKAFLDHVRAEMSPLPWKRPR
ncbi:MAG TPA: LysR family transcriptional regulator [Polyangiaceae bacterium]